MEFTIKNISYSPTSNYTQSMQITDYVWLSLLIMLGGGLRFFQIGRDSFWFDETGVASVVYIHSFADFLNLVRSHVMSVPFDYMITWLVGQICNNETCLRLPSAIWSILSLWIAFLLCKQLFNLQTALFTGLIMALSPLLIQYAQEVRFYSALVFFYLLSSYWLIRALRSSKNRYWLLGTFALSIGIFFHIYTALALINGWACFLFLQINKKQRIQILRKLIICSLITFLALLLAFYTFLGFTTPLGHGLLDFESSSLRLFGIAFGWVPFFENSFSIAWLWGILLCIFEIIGIIFLLVRYPVSNAAAVIYSSLLQFCLIITANIIKHYALTPRQFIALFPIGIIFSAYGFYITSEWISKKKVKELRIFRIPFRLISLVNGLLVAILLLASIPAINNYYVAVKSKDREIAAYLETHWQPGETIIAIPMLTAEALKYYLVQRSNKEYLLPYLKQASEQDLDKILAWEGKIYLVAPLSFVEKNTSLLISSGFIKNEIRDPQGSWILFTREDY